jgi:ABC-type ATPase with predicted acetyltransferase domain
MINKPWSVHHEINIAFDTSVERTERVLAVAETFGLELMDKKFEIYKDFKFTTSAGERVYITGESGSGKSLILGEITRDYIAQGLTVRNISDVKLEDKPLIDQVGKDAKEASQILSAAGLNDAYLLVRKPNELSDGQKYRFRIALLLAENTDVWICDEFGAILDRDMAKALAYSLRKISERNGINIVIATTHRDLKAFFGPHHSITKRYGIGVKLEKTDLDELDVY